MNDIRKTSAIPRVVTFVLVFVGSFAVTIGLLSLNRQQQQQQPKIEPRLVETIQPIKLKVVSVDSEENSADPGFATNAVDGNPSTFWHTEWRDAGPPPPHEIVIELIPPTMIKGFTYLPRQDDSDHGQIKDYEFFTSDDAKEFTRPVTKGIFSPGKSLKTETFEPIKARFIKLKALSEINGLAWTSAAEIGVVPVEQ